MHSGVQFSGAAGGSNPRRRFQLRAVTAELRKAGRLQIDESAIREAYEQNRRRVEQAKVESKTARRERARREHRKSLPAANPDTNQPVAVPSQDPRELEPFEIEVL